MKLGEYINNYLFQNKISQRQFAKICELSNGYISMLISGKNPKTGKPLIPSITALLSIANGMGISLDELISQTDDITVDISASKNLFAASYHLTQKEKAVLTAYRKHPEMQQAVDTLLGITADTTAALLDDMAQTVNEYASKQVSHPTVKK